MLQYQNVKIIARDKGFKGKIKGTKVKIEGDYGPTLNLYNVNPEAIKQLHQDNPNRFALFTELASDTPSASDLTIKVHPNDNPFELNWKGFMSHYAE